MRKLLIGLILVVVIALAGATYILPTYIKLDKVNLNELSLKGENIEISVQDLLLARRLVINSADNLTITGLIDENNLAQLLAKEVDKISDIAVKITPFRITDANTENRLFGKIGISFTKDIFLVSTDKLPLEGAKFTRVEQQNGQVLIEAGINK